ncbi:MAG: hypothetical protein GY754_03580 [bacterium]|nr:hypothetical protein [bacterium]
MQEDKDRFLEMPKDDINIPKVKGDDIHETAEVQLDYLRNAGFENIDLYVKYHLWCIIGGQK